MDSAATILGLQRIERPFITVVPEDFQAYWLGHPLTLTAKPFIALAMVARRPNLVTSRSQILELTDPDGNYDTRSVETHIKHVRKALALACPGEPCPIKTVYSLGWKWVEPAYADPQAPALASWEEEAVLFARQGMPNFKIAAALKRPVPEVNAVLLKARSMGIGTAPTPAASLLPSLQTGGLGSSPAQPSTPANTTTPTKQGAA